jgi:hypothetical protein
VLIPNRIPPRTHDDGSSMVTVIGYLSTLFGTTFAFFTTARDLNHLIRRLGKSMKKNRKEEEEGKRIFFKQENLDGALTPGR